MKQHVVEEVPGLYGPVRIPERLLQQIWSRSDFDSDNLVALEGHSIKVISSGNGAFAVSSEGISSTTTNSSLLFEKLTRLSSTLFRSSPSLKVPASVSNGFSESAST